MKPAVAQRLRLLGWALGSLLLLVLLVLGWGYWQLRASLPQLDGPARLAGLAAPVSVERDALGVPTIRGGSRGDAARALGFLHAQERFFQMDLMRRRAAGELAEIFGPRAVALDRAARVHAFRARAGEVVARLPAAERALLEAYTAGVNAGLAALGARPFEYLILRETPRPWAPEDSLLVSYAITLDLQDGANRYEQALHVLQEQFGPGALAFFNPLIGPNDAALDGSTAPLAPIPGPEVIDLRSKKVVRGAPAGGAGGLAALNRESRASPLPQPPPLWPASFPADFAPGSNAFAIAGAHTATGGAALLASDMHLGLSVPNTWYRAVITWPAAPPAPAHRIVGVTLPGTPAIISGSNGAIAWGFTAGYVDTNDLILVEQPPQQPDRYLAPGQPGGLAFQTRRETIRVKGAPPVTFDWRETIWGPITAHTEGGTPLAMRWVSHEIDAANLDLIHLETAASAGAAVAIAQRAGLPALNFIVADRAGEIAWTIAGRLPRRVGFDGRLPVSWASGEKRWAGLLPPEEVPVFATKGAGIAGAAELRDGRVWSANHRHVGGAALARIGDGDYARAHRAGMIRDDLAALTRATPRDLLDVQLNDRTTFLQPWHAIMLGALTPEATAAHPPRAALRSFLEPWDERASVDAVSYRLVRDFRIEVYARLFQPIFAPCDEALPGFPWNSFQLEAAAHALLRERPMHLLDPRYSAWDELLLRAIDDLIKQIDRQGVKLPHANWGWRNRARIQHPFGNLLPSWIGSRLNLPADPLPGDHDMPRVQSPTFGASERLVVAPGREDEGIFHMPGGQSAHPLSPYFRAGHSAWVKGEPTPLLPGQTERTLRLEP